MLTEAGLDEFTLEQVYGNGLVPGVTTKAELKDPTNLCNGAVERKHSHFFTADGAFGSKDFEGQQVDDGTYVLEGDDTVVINGMRFHYRIDGDSLTLDPEPVDTSGCTTKECKFGAAWVLMVALPGSTWTRGEIPSAGRSPGWDLCSPTSIGGIRTSRVRRCIPTGCMWDYMTSRLAAGRVASRRDRTRTALAGRRHRPGDDQQPVHPVRPRRSAGGEPPARASADHAAARVGRARSRRDPRARPGVRAGRACARPVRTRGRLPRSASATSARRPSSGTGGRVGRSTTRSSGRTRGPPRRCAAGGIGDEGPIGIRATDRAADLDLFERPEARLDPRTPARERDAGRRSRVRDHRSGCIWHLTGGVDGGVHVTDVTNASRTMLMDLATCEWDPSILDELGIPASMLPEIRGSSEVYGTGRGELDGVPIAGDPRRPAGGPVRPDLLRGRARRSAPTARARSC